MLERFFTARNLQWVERITGALLSLLIPLYAWKVWEQGYSYTDFSVYYQAALRFGAGKFQEIYSLADGACPFRYPPFFLPFFSPLARLNFQTARLTWYFLQVFCFGGGFYFIFKTLRALNQPQALGLTGLSFLFVLRFCLDCWMIGQVSSLMFLGLSLAAYFWVTESPRLTAFFLLLPSLFKIGPAVIYGVFLCRPIQEIRRAIQTVVISLSVALVGLTFSLRSSFSSEVWQKVELLWKNWLIIVLNDSQYFDASHYGSQSMKSFLLRGVKSSLISAEMAQRIYLWGTLLTCGLLFFFWCFRKPRSPLGRGLFFSLGIFIYLWFMPETFKYSLSFLALPVAFLLTASRLNQFQVFSLFFGACVLSIPGKDVVGDFLFFGFQNLSLPFFATVALGLSALQQAFLESEPKTIWSQWIQPAWRILLRKPEALGPWKQLPPQDKTLDCSVLIPIQLSPPSSDKRDPSFRDFEFIEGFLNRLEDQLNQAGLLFELILIPYGEDQSTLKEERLLNDPRFMRSPSASRKILNSIEATTRARALRSGYLISRGHFLLITKLEQPCEPSFFTRAIDELKRGSDLVRGNRRLSGSRFEIPVRFLSLVYRRHQLGLGFNQALRLLLPIQTTDTQGGNLALSDKLAQRVFALQGSTDFLFDLEVSLTATGHDFLQTDLPVCIQLTTEKPIAQVFLETLQIAKELPSLLRRYKKGYYRPYCGATGITADDWGMSSAINQGILELAQSGVIRRVSLMANTGFLEEGLEELKKLPVELGLHFNFTYGRSLSGAKLFSSPQALLLAWLKPSQTQRSLPSETRRELVAQIQKLRSLGVHIAYFDGHHHIQIIPGLIQSIADILHSEGIKKVRLPYDPSLWLSTKAPLVFLAALSRASFTRHGFEFMKCIYPQKAHFFDQGRLRACLSQGKSAEVIVHPASHNDLHTLEFQDSYTEGRVLEYQALRMLGIDS